MMEELCEYNECWKIPKSNFKISTQGETIDRASNEEMEGKLKTVTGLKA
jgi:hypothetical protein